MFSPQQLVLMLLAGAANMFFFATIPYQGLGGVVDEYYPAPPPPPPSLPLSYFTIDHRSMSSLALVSDLP